MARKKQTHKQKHEDVEQSPFWPLAGGILLCVLALFLLFGGFGTGGPLPVGLFKGAYAALGWAAYLLPMALVYWGVHKFMAEDHQIPLGKLLSMIGLLVFVSSWLFTAFSTLEDGVRV
ncbi:MAG TPA: DNA translocase FtsK 4TM domain-containing protein, partial [Candidatus Saccharimonadales bacterium]|nr:DNA translocase FtsK 4TM domain-containing protein [Candidatus Saccharimonadales bacterium]